MAEKTHQVQEFSSARQNHASVFVDLTKGRVTKLHDPGAAHDLADKIRRQQQVLGVRFVSRPAA
jgi:hypothetical protein